MLSTKQRCTTTCLPFGVLTSALNAVENAQSTLFRSTTR